MENAHLFGMYITERDCGIVKRFTMTNRERRKGAPYTRINGEWYIDNDGILRRFKKSETKGDNIKSVKRSFGTSNPYPFQPSPDPDCRRVSQDHM